MFNTVQALPKKERILAIREANPRVQTDKENVVSVFCTKTGTFLFKLVLRQPVGTVQADDELLYVCNTVDLLH